MASARRPLVLTGFHFPTLERLLCVGKSLGKEAHSAEPLLFLKQYVVVIAYFFSL